jgi:hypothetical protein
MQTHDVTRRAFAAAGVTGLTSAIAADAQNATAGPVSSITLRMLDLFEVASAQLADVARAENVPENLLALRGRVIDTWESISTVAVADMRSQVAGLSQPDLASIDQEVLNLGLPHILEVVARRSGKEEVLTGIEGVADLIPGKVGRFPIKTIIRAGTGLFRFFQGLFS